MLAAMRRSASVLALVLLAAQPRALGAVGSCPGSMALCQGDDEEPAGVLGLLQFDANHGKMSHRSAASADIDSSAAAGSVGSPGLIAASLLSNSASLRLGLAQEADPVNCSQYPTLCEAPFDCNSKPVTPEEVARWTAVGVATEDGHSNLKSWCLAPKYEGNLVKNCLKNHDLKTHAQVMFDWTVAEGIDQLDGSYCFIEGHCTNMNVTYDTTVEEAEAACDAKYGHENWTSFKLGDIDIATVRHPGASSKVTGFHSREITAAYGMAACAMGNFHCDVIYCRDTYCKKPEYVEKYGHYLKDFGYSS